ncbi:MAG: hypothetical protein P4L71_14865, partial [Acetobacteraceae bacterium]|nr:hypothetical protein [Acetobacteraceae bacterium]
MGLLAVLLSGFAAYGSWQAHETAGRISEATAVSRQLFGVLAGVRSERGMAMALLNAPDPTGDATWTSRVMDPRTSSETAYEAASASLGRLDIAGL